MRKKTFRLIILLMVVLLPDLKSIAQDNPSSISLSEHDRILILAPHPDDETIGAGGIIQESKKLGLPLRVVYLTSGDHNELAFIVYEKRIVFRKKAFLHMGEVRRQEAIKAMEFLGVDKGQLIFLGYPDSGTFRIFTEYWGEGKSFKSLLTRVTHVPYQDCFSPKAPYTGESVLSDLEKIIKDFKPTKIFVSHPADTNGDHQAFYLFLTIALWDLKPAFINPRVYNFSVHVMSWPKPRGFHPDLRLEPPPKLQNSQLNWQAFELTKEQVFKKRDAISFYKSQIGYNPWYLYTFARANELFGAFPDFVLKREDEQGLHWETLEDTQVIMSPHVNKYFIKSIAYKLTPKYLYIRIDTNPLLSEFSATSLYLMPYKKGRSFAGMPKIRLSITKDKDITVFERRKSVSIDEFKVDKEGENLIVRIPRAALGNPDFILTSHKTHVTKLPFEATAWRVLELK